MKDYLQDANQENFKNMRNFVKVDPSFADMFSREL